MKRKELIVNGLLILAWSIVSAAGIVPQEKVESATPIPTLSPPEGNMTFTDGVTWCVARPGVPQEELQNALDWACGQGAADCRCSPAATATSPTRFCRMLPTPSTSSTSRTATPTSPATSAVPEPSSRGTQVLGHASS